MGIAGGKGGTRQRWAKGKNWDNYNNIINKIYLKNTELGHGRIREMALSPVQQDHLPMSIYVLIGKGKGLTCIAITKSEIHSIIPSGVKTKQRAGYTARTY